MAPERAAGWGRGPASKWGGRDASLGGEGRVTRPRGLAELGGELGNLVGDGLCQLGLWGWGAQGHSQT